MSESNGNGSAPSETDVVAVPDGEWIEKGAAPKGEIGASGLEVNSGRVQDEFLKKLSGRRKTATFREMQDNDPIVGSVLYGIQMLIREIGWRAEAADETPEAIRWSDFLESCLHDMSMTWPQTLTSVVSFLPYGWAYNEIVYKLRGGDVDDGKRRSRYDDGLVGWRKFPLRAQESLARWEFDDEGGVKAMVQSNQGSGEVSIPIEKALLFRTTAARSDPEGRSILRNAYRPWYFKKRIEEIESIGIERDLAGLPVVKVPEQYLMAGATDAQKRTVLSMKELATRIKRNAQEGLVFPTAVDEFGHDRWAIELLSTGGQRQFDTNTVIGRYNQEIAMTVLADFVLLGHEKVGSYALGATKVELFTVALAAWVDEIAGVFNDYAVPRLMKFNGVPSALWPTIEHDEIKTVDLGALGTFIRDAVGSGAVSPGPELEGWLREQAQIPPEDEEEMRRLAEEEPTPPEPVVVVPVPPDPAEVDA